MSDKVKYIFNPFTAQLDAVQNEQVNSAKSITQIRNCDISALAGDFVMESSSITNGVDVSVNNTDVRPTIGVIIRKLTDTTCEVLFFGTLTGFSGLTKGRKLFLDTDGTITSTAVTSGYLQCLGTARDSDTVDFNPQLNRVMRT